MAKLTDEDVLKLAQLSRLRLSLDDVQRFKSEISTILSYVEQLKSVDLDDLPPTDQVTGLKNVTRPDVVRDYKVAPEQLLENAPALEKGQIKVRKVL
ncbi:MAG: Asp-tRNA(Asn)/Glu-tRNA(Gln) amidotransferase subunit GatC [Candidatus Saccharibacteria bacterium]|nr:Asp-tRNA(Asn)/Glu-tRNA(Gln) amidotransferase subunit GatC [Candidatus Saccharibacteria bacterium]